MIHCRDHLIDWLVSNSSNDVLLRNAFRKTGTRVELLGLFDPLPGSSKPGWLVRVTSYSGREDLISIVKDHLDRPHHWYTAPNITWETWQGPDNDALIGGDSNGQESKTGRNFDRIKRCAAVHSTENRSESDRKTSPPVVKGRSFPPHVPP
jgi:hypothetical protein